MAPLSLRIRGLAACVPRASSAISSSTRTFASVLPSVPISSQPTKLLPAPPANGQQRPQLNIEVNANHGLYAFFRKNEEGQYETVEPVLLPGTETGRSWTAAELRRKSFRDLHTLWYVLLRERNLLATQREEARRLQINPNRTAATQRTHKVRKSMARIKYVINERRLAYEGALKIFAGQREHAQEKETQAVIEAQKRTELPESRKTEDSNKNQAKAAELAAAGLFETVEQSSENRS